MGTLMCASAFTAMLWRRRIRVIGYSVVLICSCIVVKPAITVCWRRRCLAMCLAI
ncbi:MAG: hypothetical protein ACLSUZ_05375 [Bifidobacterium pseudocatenulatum]